jgi:radical SAM protein with 4Fe4S-binding SPASM domain
MRYFLSHDAVLKWLETPSVYHIKRDELYELDHDAFTLLRKCASQGGCTMSDHDFLDYCLREGLLITDRASAKHPPLTKSPVPSLRYLELQITDRCNLRCKHCFIEEGFSELSIHHVRDILQQFEDMQGLRVLITGGEPLLHSRLRELCDMLPDFSVRKVLLTNGILLSSTMLKTLNVQEIQISIDGLERAHDSLRGKGAYKSAVRGLHAALDAGYEVSVSTMVHPGNLGDFDAMEKLFKTMTIKDWTVDIPCVAGRLKQGAAFQVSPEIGGRYLRYGFGGGLHSGAEGYACGSHLMAVTADGRAAKCTFFSANPVGRIEEGLRTSWQRIRHIRLDELKCDCSFIESCRGGCRYRALLFGDGLGKDFYRCHSYDIMKK